MLFKLTLLSFFSAGALAAPFDGNQHINIYNWCPFNLYIWNLTGLATQFEFIPRKSQAAYPGPPQDRQFSLDMGVKSEWTEHFRGPTSSLAFSCKFDTQSDDLWYWMANYYQVPFAGHTVTVGGVKKDGQACPRMVWRDGGGDENREEKQVCEQAAWLDFMFCDDAASGEMVLNPEG